MNAPLSLRPPAKRRFVALAGGALLALMLAACGGGDDDNSDATSDGASEAGTPSGSASTPASGATSSAGSVTNSGIDNLDSYKYTLKMTGTGGPVGDITSGLSGLGDDTSPSDVVLEVTGSFIKPDKAQTAIKVAGFETSTTVIGNQQWTTFGGQTIGPQPATASDLADANFLQGFWEGEEITDNIKDFKCGDKENVNGVSATKCTADKAVIDRMAREDPSLLSDLDASSLSNAQIDVWLTDAGYPVRMRMDVAGKDTANEDFSFKVEMDVTDINGNFQISAPRT